MSITLKVPYDDEWDLVLPRLNSRMTTSATLAANDRIRLQHNGKHLDILVTDLVHGLESSDRKIAPVTYATGILAHYEGEVMSDESREIFKSNGFVTVPR